MSEPREMSAKEQDLGFLLWLESHGDRDEEVVPWEISWTEELEPERAA